MELGSECYRFVAWKLCDYHYCKYGGFMGLYSLNFGRSFEKALTAYRYELIFSLIILDLE
ncbi:hypothetical protein DWW36_19930 [Erysipelotrichaceae bacterium AF15-26LB]|nr:hypothetical protein DWW36_19930 [Erysipelotrichaceae bacterium AF15-26LB]